MQAATKSAFTYATLILTMLLWGGTFIAARNLTGILGPADAAFLRFLVASCTLITITLLVEKQLTIPPARMVIPIICLGLTGVFAYNYFFFRGLTHIAAGRASLIVANTPLVITLLSAVLFGDRITPLKGAGVLSSLIGALVVISNGELNSLWSGGFGIGEASLVGCVVSWSAYTLIGRTVLHHLTPLTAVCYSSMIGTLFLFFPAANGHLLEKIGSASLGSWLNLVYLGVGGTTIAFFFYYRAISKIGAPRAAIFINLVPVFAVILSWLILDETLPPAVLGGGVLVLAGITMTNIQSRQ